MRTALVNLIFYALFAPACGQMINRIMYMSEAVMEADEAIGRLDEILSQQPMEEPKAQKRLADDAVAFDHVTFTYPGADRPALEDVSFFRPARTGGGSGGSLRRGQDHRRQPDPPVLGCGQRQRHRRRRRRAGAG